MNPERMLRDFEKFSQQLHNYLQSLEDRFAWLVRTPLMVEIFIFAMLFFVCLLYVLGEKRKHLLIFLLILACPPTVFIPGLGKSVRESVWLSLKDNADQNNLWGWLYGLTPEGKGWSRKQVVYASVLITILAVMCVQVVKLAREVEVDGGNAVPMQEVEVSVTVTSTATIVATASSDATSAPVVSSTAIPTNSNVATQQPFSLNGYWTDLQITAPKICGLSPDSPLFQVELAVGETFLYHGSSARIKTLFGETIYTVPYERTTVIIVNDTISQKWIVVGQDYSNDGENNEYCIGNISRRWVQQSEYKNVAEFNYSLFE